MKYNSLITSELLFVQLYVGLAVFVLQATLNNSTVMHLAYRNYVYRKQQDSLSFCVF